MSRNNSLLYLLSISACFINHSVARVAIVNGEKAKEDQFPYQVALIDRVQGQYCGGGIIDNQFILTAAHCVVKSDGHFNGKHIKVVGAINHLQPASKTAVGSFVQKIYVPTEFSPGVLGTTADIAVLKLQKPFEFSKHVKKLALPRGKTELFVGDLATIAGFGWEKIKRENGSTVAAANNTKLLYGEAEILNSRNIINFTEKHMYGKMRQRPHHDRGACIGDSGGPLVHDNIVIGILSMSPKECIEKTKPAVYTRVSHFLDFIHDSMKDKTNKYIRPYVLLPPLA